MKVMPIFSDLRPKIGQKPSAAEAVAVEAKLLAMAVGFGLWSTPVFSTLKGEAYLYRKCLKDDLILNVECLVIDFVS